MLSIDNSFFYFLTNEVVFIINMFKLAVEFRISGKLQGRVAIDIEQDCINMNS